MHRPKVLILGATGMLGSMLGRVFATSRTFDLVAADRLTLDAQNAAEDDIARVIHGARWVINAIGITKPHIHDDNPHEIERAIAVNGLFPHRLARVAQRLRVDVIQIATDCVFSGRRGQYVETDPHDALDVYGKTKSLGEAVGHGVYHLRCSIIGPEIRGHQSLLDWFLSQPNGARVSGFTNHRWNGITTLAFAKICMGIIKKGIVLPHVQHIVPADGVTKAQLLKVIAREFGRKDAIIQNTNAKDSIDRTLVTNNRELNRALWQLAGYRNPPTIEEMVKELSTYA